MLSLRHRRIFILSALLIAFAAAYAIYWTTISSRLRQEVVTWIEARRAAGYALTHADLRREGFPFTVRIVIDEPAVAAPGSPPAWSWSAAAAAVEAPAVGADSLHVRLLGRQQVALRGPDFLRTYTGEAAELSARIRGGGWLPAGEATVRDLTLTPADGTNSTGGVGIGKLVLAAAGDPAAPVDEKTTGYALTVDAAALKLPHSPALPLGTEVAEAHLKAELLGALHATPWPAALARWRDDGGTVELKRLRLTYDRARFDGDGTFALDAAGQPVGAMTVRIQGFTEALDALAHQRVIDTGAAALAKAVLKAVAEADAAGQQTLTVPMTLQERTLFVGPVPLARLPAVDWLGTKAPTWPR
jgi:hypothetical protein